VKLLKKKESFQRCSYVMKAHFIAKESHGKSSSLGGREACPASIADVHNGLGGRVSQLFLNEKDQFNHVGHSSCRSASLL